MTFDSGPKQILRLAVNRKVKVASNQGYACQNDCGWKPCWTLIEGQEDSIRAILHHQQLSRSKQYDGTHDETKNRIKGSEIMGLFGSMVGGALGAEILQVVESTVAKHGGVQGLINQFQAGGLGNVAKSWVSSGANQPVTPNQIKTVLGTDSLTAIASQNGMTVDKIAALLAQHLPTAIDKATPSGTIH
jgi:uncharacterized protein YidB (DUF937 family)